MRIQDWAFLAASAGVVLTIGFGLFGFLLPALLFAALTLLAATVSRLKSKRHPGPMSPALNWVLHLPRGPLTPNSLLRLLDPHSGERILEVGTGIGVYALPVARSLLPDGTLDAVDIQKPMLDALSNRATAAGLANISAILADAECLPYPDNVFDSAYLITVIGEIPGPGNAFRELSRVLKPDGRLIIGEIVVDPDFVATGTLKSRAAAAGFAFVDRRGPGFAYLARWRLAPPTPLRQRVR